MQTKNPGADTIIEQFKTFHSSLQELLQNVEKELKEKGKDADKTAQAQLDKLKKIDDQIRELSASQPSFTSSIFILC